MGGIAAKTGKKQKVIYALVTSYSKKIEGVDNETHSWSSLYNRICSYGSTYFSEKSQRNSS